MQIIAVTCWSLVVVLTALGVHRMWCGIVRPRIIDAVLLPGTLLARLGYVLGLLITGGAVRNVRLLSDEDGGDGDPGGDHQTRVPVVGPVIVALLPLAVVVFAIHLTLSALGGPLQSRMDALAIDPAPPRAVAGIWQVLRDQITLVESLVSAIGALDIMSWRSWVLMYLLICLVVRIAPGTGCLRGALGGIILMGVVTGVANLLLQRQLFSMDIAWRILGVTQATALLLLLIGLLVRGTISLVRIVRFGA
jgi:hypothetical protein